jgi:hypothetical protein
LCAFARPQHLNRFQGYTLPKLRANLLSTAILRRKHPLVYCCSTKWH